MDKIKNQLAGVAALLGVIAAIGGGFVKYGEVMTKLEILEAKESADYSSQIAVLEEKVEALSVQHSHTKTLINEKQIELLKVQIEELKASSSNPLAN
jgi:Na+-translocating ferredoxin:NAD+ oxidoreductase RnfG subunit